MCWGGGGHGRLKIFTGEPAGVLGGWHGRLKIFTGEPAGVCGGGGAGMVD